MMVIISSLIFSSLIFFISAVGAAKDDILLNSYPLIMSHDAASGEIIDQRDFILREWTDTQGSTLVQQLDCGSRSFDYRPYLSGDTVIAHHGGVEIHKPMDESLNEVEKWCSDNQDDLVIFYITDCEGDGNCYEEVVNLLNKHNIYTITDCSVLQNLTYGKAKSESKLEDGGYLMAVINCLNSNYDPSIVCYDRSYTCYDSWPNDTSDIPYQNFAKYINQTTLTNPSIQSSNLWTTQAIWQSTAETVILGTLHNSSLVLDEERSGLNKWVENAIYEGKMPYLNFLELNHICNNGLNIYKAIESSYLSKN